MATAEAIEPDVDHHGDDHDHPEWLAHHFETPEQQFDAGKLGIWLFLAQEVLFFTGLFVAYAVYRINHPEVFADAANFLNPTLGALNTIVLLASSLAIAWAVRAAQRNEQGLLLWLHIFTLACAGLFMGVKVVEYAYKFDEGLYWAGSYTYTDGQALPDEGFHTQLHWVFIASAVIGGAVMLGGWMMHRLASARGALIAGLGWALMAYLMGAGVSSSWVGSITGAQEAKVDEAKAAVAAAEENVPEAGADAEAAGPVMTAAPEEGAEATAEPDPAAGPTPEQVLEEAEFDLAAAESAVWSDTLQSVFSFIVIGSIVAVAFGLGWWFMGSFRGDRKAWGAVALGLGACIVGMAGGVVVARAIQAGATHHGDHHGGDHHSEIAHSDEHHSDAAHADEHHDAEHHDADHSKDGYEGETPEVAEPAAAPAMAAAVPDVGVTAANFFSIYFAMTGVHALHIFAGIVVIAWIIGRIARGDFTPAFYGPVEYVGLYWHLVDLVWIYLFPLLYLIH